MEETPTPPPINGDEVERRVREETRSGEVPPDRAQRFYDRVRKSIQEFVNRKGRALGKTAEYLMLVPDVFILLWRLTTDARVSGKNKVLLGSAVAYFILPFDLIPEAVVGPIGYLDDLVFGVFVLNRMLKDTDPAVLREHWSGSEDVLDVMHRVLNAADSLVESKVLGRLKKMVRK
jgi:uncharacterized membrane protein YkvA (DUF1232 family)